MGDEQNRGVGWLAWLSCPFLILLKIRGFIVKFSNPSLCELRTVDNLYINITFCA